MAKTRYRPALPLLLVVLACGGGPQDDPTGDDAAGAGAMDPEDGGEGDQRTPDLPPPDPGIPLESDWGGDPGDQHPDAACDSPRDAEAFATTLVSEDGLRSLEIELEIGADICQVRCVIARLTPNTTRTWPKEASRALDDIRFVHGCADVVMGPPPADAEVGDFFDRALEEAAGELGRPELAFAPWVLWGHYPNDLLVADMASERPDRTVAAIGGDCGLELSGDGLEVPALSILGAKTTVCGPLFEQTRVEPILEQGALYAVAVEPGSGSGASPVRGHLILPFLHAVLSRRLPARWDGTDFPPLGNMTEQPAFRGNNETLEWGPAEAVPPGPRTSWLVDELVARRWQDTWNGLQHPSK